MKKRIISVVMIFVVAMNLVGCSSSKKTRYEGEFLLLFEKNQIR